MIFTRDAAMSLAVSEILKDIDIKVWLYLVDNVLSTDQIATLIDKSVRATSNSVNRLLDAGWIKVVDRTVERKKYTALPDLTVQCRGILTTVNKKILRNLSKYR